jgi:hypothetical protein
MLSQIESGDPSAAEQLDFRKKTWTIADGRR